MTSDDDTAGEAKLVIPAPTTEGWTINRGGRYGLTVTWFTKTETFQRQLFITAVAVLVTVLALDQLLSGPAVFRLGHESTFWLAILIIGCVFLGWSMTRTVDLYRGEVIEDA